MPNLSAWAGTAISRWDLEASIDLSRTDGYILVPASQRGTVDTVASSEHATVDASLGYKVGDNGRAFLRGSFFDEARHSGTPLQKNSTATGFGAAGIHSGIGANDSITARVYGQSQGYDQTFSSIDITRSSETLTNLQHVPSQQVGAGLQWEHVLKSQALMAGVDWQEVMGASDEQLVSISAINIAGGRQRSAGIFGQDIFRIRSKWTVIAGIRWDDWKNFHGSTVRIPASGSLVSQAFMDRNETSFSPRASLLRALSGNLSFVLSGYRAFRAPTLNELYRSFRQGITVTSNNPLLRAERLTGAETGLRATALDNRLESRGTFFWGDIVNPVTNVTISSTPTLITRQRQNLGRTRSLGMELDTAFHLNSSIQFSGGYQYTHATVVDSSPSLVGLNVPEVPRHQFTWEARYWRPSRLMFSIEGRYSGAQYDDDQNTLKLDRYYVTNVFIGRELPGGLLAYAAVENLFNQRYSVALAPPISNLGPPILARAGLRYEFPADHK